MKNEFKTTTKIASKLALKTKLMWLIAGFSALSILMLIMFFYFYAGNPSDSKGGTTNYYSAATGNWNSNATWGGNPPPVTNMNGGEIVVNSGHTVTLSGDLSVKNNTTITINSGGTLLINGSLEVNDNLTLYVNGTLSIAGDIIAKNGSTVTVNSDGTMEVSGDATFGNNADFIINGTLSIGQNITFGSNPDFIGNGNVELGGLGCTYYGGTGTCTENTILPVELLGFEATTEGNRIRLTWKTASETNNDYFGVQKSENGVDFTTIQKVPGKGTTKETSEYEYFDNAPMSGVSYYRLTQTDKDGTTEVFRPVSVNYEGGAETSFTIYPNPLSGNNLHVSLNEVVEGSIMIFDTNGIEVFNETVSPNANQNIDLRLENNLEKGIYFVYYKTKSFEKSIKLIKL